MRLTLPGHGDAPDPQGSFDDAVRALLAGLPGTVDEVVGYSLGGRVALRMLTIAPERFRTAVIVSAHPGLADARARAERRAQDRAWVGLLRRQGIEAFVDAWERQPLLASQLQLPQEKLEEQRSRRLGHRAEGLARSLEALGLAEMPSSWTDVARYTGRLCWIAGERDTKFLGIARVLKQHRPDTHLEILRDVGHNPLLEAPSALRALVRAHAA